MNWTYQPVDKLVERPSHDFGVAVKSDVAEAIFPHPTQTEWFGELARRLLVWLRRTAKVK